MAVTEARADGAGTTVLDLDWRPMLWDDPADYAAAVRVCARMADIVLGSDEEITAAAGVNEPARLLAPRAGRDRAEARPRRGDRAHARRQPPRGSPRTRSRS